MYIRLFRKNARYSLLTNFEVMQMLRTIKDTKKKKTGLRNLATIAYETLQFLENTPCINQSQDKIVKFLGEIKPFKLTKHECMMIVNNPPSSQLHIQFIIEDSEERLTETQVQEILQIVTKSLNSAE